MLMPSYYRDVTQFLDNVANWTQPLDGKVYVIPESEYANLKRKQALEEIKILENRATSYEGTAASIRKTVKELKIEAGLLPAKEEEEAAGTPASLDASQS